MKKKLDRVAIYEWLLSFITSNPGITTPDLFVEAKAKFGICRSTLNDFLYLLKGEGLIYSRFEEANHWYCFEAKHK